jgi:hypothetical protein
MLVDDISCQYELAPNMTYFDLYVFRSGAAPVLCGTKIQKQKSRGCCHPRLPACTLPQVLCQSTKLLSDRRKSLAGSNRGKRGAGRAYKADDVIRGSAKSLHAGGLHGYGNCTRYEIAIYTTNRYSSCGNFVSALGTKGESLVDDAAGSDRRRTWAGAA